MEKSRFFRVGDRVIVSDSSSVIYGEIGAIIEVDIDTDFYHIKLDNGTMTYKAGEQLRLWESIEKQGQPDNINSPAHYNRGNMETIDKIDMMLSDKVLTPMGAVCLGNVIKYIDRHQYKGKPAEDIKKAIWYLERFVDILEQDN